VGGRALDRGEEVVPSLGARWGLLGEQVAEPVEDLGVGHLADRDRARQVDGDRQLE